MNTKEKFTQLVSESYSFKGESVNLGAAIYSGEVLNGVHVKLPLKTMNRHGLISGATGTGKTKTLQLICEGLSSRSVPVLVMDIKGDLSGIAVPGVINEKISDRMSKIGLPWNPSGFPVEFLSLSDEKGVRLRATVSEFGPVLFSRILGLNETQSSIVSVLFKYADDNQLPLLDLKDMKQLINHIQNEGEKGFEADYGAVSTSSLGIILRKIVELEGQGADVFFGERSFDVEDLVRFDQNGRGVISVIRLTDIQNKPKLFSTFMLCLLAEIYMKFDEEGDLDQPKLVVFIDEAHLVFSEAESALLEQIETIIKLIRSKGIGIFFCTQNPRDIPQSVLSQLGMKIQHALRVFTAKDRKELKLISENYPLSEFYKTDELLTSLGIGEAAVTLLNEKGNPTPLVATLLCAPSSRMDVLTTDEMDSIIKSSTLINKYNEHTDRESAYEILSSKMQFETNKISEGNNAVTRKKEISTFDKILGSSVARQVGRTAAREITRGILGVFGIGSSRRKRGWF